MALQAAVWFRVELHANLIEGHAQQSVFGCPLVLGEDHKNILPGLLGLPSSFRVTLRLDLRCVGGWKCSLTLVSKAREKLCAASAAGPSHCCQTRRALCRLACTQTQMFPRLGRWCRIESGQVDNGGDVHNCAPLESEAAQENSCTSHVSSRGIWMDAETSSAAEMRPPSGFMSDRWLSESVPGLKRNRLLFTPVLA